MPELLQAISDISFYAVCFGLAILLLNGGGGGGKRSWIPI
jgi:hypothetical protein